MLAIVSYLKRSFSNAEIVTDRFHIVQHINHRFNQLRVQFMNRFRLSHTEDQKKYRRLKRYWKLLLKDSTTLEPLKQVYHRIFKRPISQTEIVDELLSYNDELREAYHFSQLLRYYFAKRDPEGFQETLKTIAPTLPQSFKKEIHDLSSLPIKHCECFQNFSFKRRYKRTKQQNHVDQTNRFWLSQLL